MSRISIPALDAAPEASKPILETVHKQLGVVPNMYRLIAQSPATLQGFTSNSAALTKTLDVRTRERIALAVAQVNGCDYCLSAHTYLGLNLAKISPEEIARNRKGGSSDPRPTRPSSSPPRSCASAETSPRLTSKRFATPASATARSWKSSPSPPRTSLPTCSTSSRRPTSTSPSSTPPKPRDAMGRAAQTSARSLSNAGSDHVLWFSRYRRDAERPGRTGGDGGWRLGKVSKDAAGSIGSLIMKRPSLRPATVSTWPRFRDRLAIRPTSRWSTRLSQAGR